MFHRLSQIKKLENKRFFSTCPSILNRFGIYVWGDAIFFIPFHLTITLISFVSLRLAFLMWAIFFSIRSVGEIFYWLLQQFSDRTYRPYDFGFCNLDNNAIYILYQTMMTVYATVSITALVIFILYWSILPSTYNEALKIMEHLIQIYLR